MTNRAFTHSCLAKRLLLSFLVLFATEAAFLQNVSGATKIRVKIEVQADNGLDRTITSYITRALREIPDARIIDSDPHVVISCVALRLRTDATNVIYAVSFAVTDNSESRLLEQNLKGFLATESQDAVTQRYARSLQLRDFSKLEYHALIASSEDELPNKCSECVKEVDDQVLKYVRDFLRLLNPE